MAAAYHGKAGKAWLGAEQKAADPKPLNGGRASAVQPKKGQGKGGKPVRGRLALVLQIPRQQKRKLPFGDRPLFKDKGKRERFQLPLGLFPGRSAEAIVYGAKIKEFPKASPFLFLPTNGGKGMEKGGGRKR